MNVIYYGEINLICIILLLLFRNQLGYRYKHLSTDNRAFSLLIWTTIVMCISDMVAGICRGQMFPGARLLIEISNLVFFEALSVGAYIWMIYVFIKLRIITHLDKKVVILAMPLIIFTLIGFTNPFTHFLFNVDENNLYVRNIGIYFHWVITWLYLITAAVKTISAILKEKNKQVKKEIIPLLYFIIAPFVASILQMLFYGITVTQVGITLSIVVVSLMEIKNQVLSDALTGLNNRHGFNKYLENHVSKHMEDELSVFMIDLNNFKQLNDKFGHMMGDRALADAADILRRVCEKMQSKLFLCRYGGDEFVISGYNFSEENTIKLQELIHEEFDKKNKSGNNPYTLQASIGFAIGNCPHVSDVDKLLHKADEAMYKDKKNSKNVFAR